MYLLKEARSFFVLPLLSPNTTQDYPHSDDIGGWMKERVFVLYKVTLDREKKIKIKKVRDGHCV
jgi:hypothetical protein